MESKLRPLEKKNLTLRTIEALKKYIASESLAEGYKLPSERDLSLKLDVSRNIIREALKSLEASSIIKKYQGKGVFVSAFSSELIANNIIFGLELSKEKFLELMEFRELFEKSIIKIIIGKINPDHISELRIIIEEMKLTQIDQHGIVELENIFFKKIISIIDNIAIERLGLITMDFFILLSLDVLIEYVHLDFEKKNELISQYEKILHSLSENNLEEALKTIRKRFDYARYKFYDFDS